MQDERTVINSNSTAVLQCEATASFHLFSSALLSQPLHRQETWSAPRAVPTPSNQSMPSFTRGRLSQEHILCSANGVLRGQMSHKNEMTEGRTDHRDGMATERRAEWGTAERRCVPLCMCSDRFFALRSRERNRKGAVNFSSSAAWRLDDFGVLHPLLYTHLSSPSPRFPPTSQLPH